MKHAYELLPPNSNNMAVVYYTGDEKAAVSFAHGNAKVLKGYALEPVLQCLEAWRMNATKPPQLQPTGNL